MIKTMMRMNTTVPNPMYMVSAFRERAGRVSLFALNLVFDVVDEVLGPLFDLVDGVLHLAAGAVGLAFVLQVVVVGEIAHGLFGPTLDVIGVRFHGVAPLHWSGNSSDIQVE